MRDAKGLQDELAKKIKPHTNPNYLQKIDEKTESGFSFELWEHSHPHYPEDAKFLFITPNQHKHEWIFEVDFLYNIPEEILKFGIGITISRFRALVTDILFHLDNGIDNINDCILTGLAWFDLGYPYKLWEWDKSGKKFEYKVTKILTKKELLESIKNRGRIKHEVEPGIVVEHGAPPDIKNK